MTPHRVATRWCSAPLATSPASASARTRSSPPAARAASSPWTTTPLGACSRSKPTSAAYSSASSPPGTSAATPSAPPSTPRYASYQVCACRSSPSGCATPPTHLRLRAPRGAALRLGPPARDRRGRRAGRALLHRQRRRDRAREGLPQRRGLGPTERLAVAQELGETSLCFLCHPTLSDEHVERTIEVVTEVMGRATRSQRHPADRGRSVRYTSKTGFASLPMPSTVTSRRSPSRTCMVCGGVRTVPVAYSVPGCTWLWSRRARLSSSQVR